MNNLMKQLFIVLTFSFFVSQYVYIVNAKTLLSRDCEILKGIYDSYKLKSFQSNCCEMSNVECTTINSEPHIIHLDLSYSKIKEIPSNIVNLNELRIINFRGNKLNGEIPTFFDKLIHLEEINLSENKFYGQIPKSFLNIKNLTTLDISNNRLFGIIPSEFCDMEKLKNIRYNDNMNSVYPSSCIREKFGYSYNNFVRVTRWVVFIGIIVIVIVFGIINLIVRQNKIKARFKRLSQRRLLRESRSSIQLRKRP